MQTMDPREAERRLLPDDEWEEPTQGGPVRHDVAYVPWEPREGGGLVVRCYRRRADGQTRARVWFGPATEGPPGHVHGGALLTAFDHALGSAAWFAGHPSFTARLEYDFRSMVPLGTLALVEAWVAEAAERKVRVEGRLLDADGHLLGDGSAIMVKMSREHLQRFERRFAGG